MRPLLPHQLRALAAAVTRISGGGGGGPGETGPKGDTGDAGADGADGASAYEIAIAEGFVGDEAAWLASLVGPAGDDGADGADGAPGSSLICVPWHAQGGGTLALTNSPVSTGRIALNQPTRMVKMVPLNGHTQVRMVGVQVTTSASANTPRLRLRAKTGAYSTTVGDYAAIGDGEEVEFTLTGTGARDTGWIDIASAPVTGDYQVALIELGGNGTADPALGHLNVYFR